ncbi:MAG TPA: efflux RND transporter periplasmic adaptor subunit [Geminicoccus sp.]|uniref:efflux RND transporter periplasmic adaptor subunit n=1 Tax=Geminicoccus sp. TaxID=2024832 RepID=UPI002C67E502|nr:efflux RND transporter periplasmic adaptor subunit [Geminicoccus sp.]HWL69007.1 efflux RND transporter periplasmic adaptor subunit [Geminicoccus sp.]
MSRPTSAAITRAARFIVLAWFAMPPAGAQEVPAAQVEPPPAVTVVRVARKPITPTTTFTGRIEAIDEVALRARVPGYLEQRLFQEGAEVQVGDLLFTIEKAPYQTTIDEISATIERIQATLRLAEIDVERQAALVKRQATAQTKLDEAEARLGETKGDLMRQNAALARARLDLGYTDIKSPLTGRIGRANFSVGDFVGPDSGPLATVVAQDPVYVTFPVSQRQLLELRNEAARRGSDPRNVTIRLRLADGSSYQEVGRLDFVDVQVDPGTDSVQVRAKLPNPDNLLIDRQLVTVLAETAEPELVLMVPQQSLQADQGGTYVLVVDAEDKVQVRRVVTGERQGAGVVVAEGLSENELVVTEGAQKVRPGQVVDAAEAAGS